MNLLKQGIQNHPETKDILIFMAIVMHISGLMLIVFAGYLILFVHNSIWAKLLGAAVGYAGADLIKSVWGRSLIKAGPIAKLMYPRVLDLDCTCDKNDPCDNCRR